MKYPKYTETQDLRTKIPKEKYAEIITLHKSGVSIRSIAKSFNVHRRTIQYILFPERLLKHKRSYNWRKYYDKIRHSVNQRKYRQRKREIFGVDTQKLSTDSS